MYLHMQGKSNSEEKGVENTCVWQAAGYLYTWR